MAHFISTPLTHPVGSQVQGMTQAPLSATAVMASGKKYIPCLSVAE